MEIQENSQPEEKIEKKSKKEKKEKKEKIVNEIELENEIPMEIVENEMEKSKKEKKLKKITEKKNEKFNEKIQSKKSMTAMAIVKEEIQLNHQDDFIIPPGNKEDALKLKQEMEKKNSKKSEKNSVEEN